MTMLIEYTHYSRLFPERATPDHVIIHHVSSAVVSPSDSVC